MKKISLPVLLTLLLSFSAVCASGEILNDVHSRLNPTDVAQVRSPSSTGELSEIVREAKKRKMSISISGGKHAMGAQQFGHNTLHISMLNMNDVLSFDPQKGLVRVEAGIQWPKLVDHLIKIQENSPKKWGIVQKQTGADNLSIGGALSANIHGRGVRFKPIIQDVESFTLVDGEGNVLTVSRSQNPELFSLVIGGYGLFGIIATVDLRLGPRVKLERKVEIVPLEDLPAQAKERLEAGFMYGDFQYKTDEKADDFMKIGVLSAYRPVGDDTPIPAPAHRLTDDKWNKLLLLAHTNKGEAFGAYSEYYKTTNGQIYWSDLHQMSYYNPEYIEYLKQNMPDKTPEGSLMISELYVPRDKLSDFIERVREDARTYEMDIIYGTMRLIERDEESFLAWAKQDYACVIFNLRVEHSPQALELAKQNFRRLIDRALALDGSYFLTYHRWATKEQVLAAYPQFPEFLIKKLKYDPEERFQSDWYRHYKKMFASATIRSIDSTE